MTNLNQSTQKSNLKIEVTAFRAFEKNTLKAFMTLYFPELGMEAVWKIRVENFPAFILIDDKGNDFFTAINQCPVH